MDECQELNILTQKGWFRKKFTLSRAEGEVFNYPMKLLVGQSEGVADGDDVITILDRTTLVTHRINPKIIHCEGKVQPTFNDLRFTTSDEITLLDYWIEAITGTPPNQIAIVWVKFDFIRTSDTIFYMYYGKADAPAYSNSVKVFGVDLNTGGNSHKKRGRVINKVKKLDQILLILSLYYFLVFVLIFLMDG